jgi:hypothetical protein
VASESVESQGFRLRLIVLNVLSDSPHSKFGMERMCESCVVLRVRKTESGTGPGSKEVAVVEEVEVEALQVLPVKRNYR